MQFAGCADAARSLLFALPVAAALLTAGGALAQNQQAQASYEQGIRALDSGRFADARADLLKAVQEDPSFAGAWLDLAIATDADGDAVEAEEFLGILEARFNLPPAIAQRVAALRARLDRRRLVASRAWQWSGTVHAGAGIDTNANAGLSLSDLTLTFPNGAVVLPIPAAQQPRRDAYVTSVLVAEGQRPAENGQYEAAASVRARANRQLHAYDTVEMQAAVAYTSALPPLGGRLPFASGPWRVGATLQQLRFGGATLLESASLNGTVAWPSLPCTPQSGLELALRHFPVANNLDSHLVWVTAGAACDNPWTGPNSRTRAQVRAGYESGRGDFVTAGGRPGDDTRHLEATLVQQWELQRPAGNERIEMQVQWAHAADTQGYSPLLGSNARRRVSRWSGSASYTFPLQWATFMGGGWQASATLQAFHQQSNLELFRVKGRVFQLGLQKSW